jgi:hypothetical protein
MFIGHGITLLWQSAEKVRAALLNGLFWQSAGCSNFTVGSAAYHAIISDGRGERKWVGWAQSA